MGGTSLCSAYGSCTASGCSNNCDRTGTQTASKCVSGSCSGTASQSCTPSRCSAGYHCTGSGSCNSTTESCNGIDDNCNDVIDEGLSDLSISGFADDNEYKVVKYKIDYVNNLNCPTRYPFNVGIWHHRSISGDPDAQCIVSSGLVGNGYGECTKFAGSDYVTSTTSYAKIDWTNAVTESTESNNTLSQTGVCVPDQYEMVNDETCTSTSNCPDLGSLNDSSVSINATLHCADEWNEDGDTQCDIDKFIVYIYDSGLDVTEDITVTLSSVPYTSYTVELYKVSGTPLGSCSGNCTFTAHGSLASSDSGYYVAVVYSNGSPCSCHCTDTYALTINGSL